jgi:hypothetical protein
MKYPYEEMGEDQFEKLVVYICKKILGSAAQGFAKGPDGGRDAKFVGTAECHPSIRSPWSGTIIVQAKHTIGINAKFSDSDFSSPENQSSTIELEIPRIKKLYDGKKLDYYMLFTNRRLTGNADDAIRERISKETGLPKANIFLAGVEQIEDYLKVYPDICTHADIDPIDYPLSIDPADLADVINGLASNANVVKGTIDDLPLRRISYDEKNKLNGLSSEYAEDMIRKYLPETASIPMFLASPENEELQRKYVDVADELQKKIIAKRKSYQSFDEVMNYVADILIKRDSDLARHKRLTRVVLFYMYWSCDIGLKPNAPTD